jgi:hypothetical protein
MEKFRTGRLAARSWQIEDLPLAMELWGDPAVTALIDSRGKLFFNSGLGSAWTEVKKVINSVLYGPIPYASEQGIFCGLTGN